MGSKMYGMVSDCKRMYEIIENWDSFPSNNDEKCYIYGMGYAISDAPFFGYTGTKLENEIYHYENVRQKYLEFKKALEEAFN